MWYDHIVEFETQLVAVMFKVGTHEGTSCRDQSFRVRRPLLSIYVKKKKNHGNGN